jgi:hypothetical protein
MTDQIMFTLQQSLRGRLIGPSDADYDAAPALYKGMIDKRPCLIARCVDVADVIAAVNFGCDQGLLVAISGGHARPGAEIERPHRVSFRPESVTRTGRRFRTWLTNKHRCHRVR